MGQSLAPEIWHVAVFEDLRLTMPIVDVGKCTHLLRQCKRLKTSRLRLEQNVILLMWSSGFKSNPGVHGLASVRGIETVEIAPIGLGDERIGSHL